MSKIRVLVVDDSALVRQIISESLQQDPIIEVVGTASDPFIARDKIVQLKPDVLTLDVEMPRMDGIEFLKRLMPQHPIPVVMVSSLTEKGGAMTLEALDAGAVDFVTKPKANVKDGLPTMMAELKTKIKLASKANVEIWRDKPVAKKTTLSTKALKQSTEKVVCIGASTGGTQAIKEVLTRFPADMVGIVIVQHMPPGFTKQFADLTDKQCAMTVKEAKDGDRILPGQVLIAKGDEHMKIKRSGGQYIIRQAHGEKVCGHCPSVEVMFQSAAKELGANAVGVMLTGMGKDGAEGMLAMRQAGASTMAQDEKTSVVFGMPKEAYANGGAASLVPLGQVADHIIKALQKMA